MPISYLRKYNYFYNVSIPIAAAVTAYARIYMANLKLNLLKQGISIYYTDTDSIFINKPLNDELIGPDLGLMKLEYVGTKCLDEAVFLPPKVYGGRQ